MARYIDADNLVSVLDILCDKGGDIRYWEQLKWIVADCPTADVVERKHGKWIYLDGLDAFECSVCGRQMVRNIFDFCPWCGAVMDERRGKDV